MFAVTTHPFIGIERPTSFQTLCATSPVSVGLLHETIRWYRCFSSFRPSSREAEKAVSDYSATNVFSSAEFLN